MKANLAISFHQWECIQKRRFHRRFLMKDSKDFFNKMDELLAK